MSVPTAANRASAANRTMRRLGISVAAGSLFFAVLAGVDAQSQKKDSGSKKNRDVYAELAKAPKRDSERRNPLERDPDAVAAGAKLFSLHCSECHGEMANGGKKGPSLRSDPVQQASPGTLFWILTNGVVRRGMPVWSKLPEPQRWQLVTYIKSLSPARSPAAADAEKTPGNAAANARPQEP